MAISRTARIFIALLLLAAAGFFWANYFQQNPLNGGPQAVPLPASPARPAPAVGPAATDVTAEGDVALQGATVAEGAAGDAAVTPPAVTAEAATEAVVPGEGSVALGDPPPVVLRHLVVDDLPFLVTSPPQLAEAELAEEDDGASERALLSARANINPFSPILVREAVTTTASAAPPAEVPSESVVVVETGAEPTSAAGTPGSGTTTTAASEPAAAPAPRTVAPPSTRASALPRQLSTGTLSSVPEILREARTSAPAPAGPADLSEVAVTLVPTNGNDIDLPLAAQEEGEATVEAVLEPLGTGALTGKPVVTGSSGLPLAVGADPLSRYLRDNNVRFTGQVLGPLSVGVFRSNVYQHPVVLTLGQTLPDSDILLADLRGYEASFSLGSSSQVLSLDSRR